MESDYQFVLERLKEERERRNLTQRMLSYCMKTQQSHFSKAENGHRRFSYHEIKELCATEVDVYYVFTGKRAKSRHDFFYPVKTVPEEILCHLNILYLLSGVAWSANRDRTSFGQIQTHLEYMRYGIGTAAVKNSIFYYVRERSGYTQQKMADILGVDIKKLRELEKGKQLPDSEIVWKMYDRFRVSPAFLLKDPRGLWNELNYALDLMEDSDRKIVLQILESGRKLTCGESKSPL